MLWLRCTDLLRPRRPGEQPSRLPPIERWICDCAVVVRQPGHGISANQLRGHVCYIPRMVQSLPSAGS